MRSAVSHLTITTPLLLSVCLSRPACLCCQLQTTQHYRTIALATARLILHASPSSTRTFRVAAQPAPTPASSRLLANDIHLAPSLRRPGVPSTLLVNSTPATAPSCAGNTARPVPAGPEPFSKRCQSTRLHPHYYLSLAPLASLCLAPSPSNRAPVLPALVESPSLACTCRRPSCPSGRRP